MKVIQAALIACLATSTVTAFTPNGPARPGFAKGFGGDVTSSSSSSTELNISGGANPYEGEMYDGAWDIYIYIRILEAILLLFGCL